MKIFVWGFLIASVLVVLLPALIYFAKKRKGPSRRLKGQSVLTTGLISAFCLGLAMFSLKFAVDLNQMGEWSHIAFLEKLFGSAAKTLQIYSMDAQYDSFIAEFTLLIEDVAPSLYFVRRFYRVWAATLNLIMPFAGCAIVLEVIAGIFPQLRLRLPTKRERYYFSELNEESLALARSIAEAAEKGKATSPRIIFTDAYTDRSDEKSSELFLEAKLLGAICVKDDISHVRKNKKGGRKFFLIDKNEAENLKALTALAGEYNREYLRNTEVFLFVESDMYVQVESNLWQELRREWGLENDDTDTLPTIIPVKSYTNLITDMLSEKLPLYEPLIGKSKAADGCYDLTVTVLGAGKIGREMFLSAYWFGQILNCRLHINVVSKESEAEFWDKIDYINPEIKATANAQDDILYCSKAVGNNPPYFTFKYHSCDLKGSEFVTLLKGGKGGLLDTDYFFVSLGNDGDNISVANTLKRYVGDSHVKVRAEQLEKLAKGQSLPSPDRVVIAYVVYNACLADTLNSKKQLSFVDSTRDIYMCAVGNLRDVYSVKNVFMKKHEGNAQKSHEAYTAIKAQCDRQKEHSKRMQDDYKHWATLAQSMHRWYRIFAADVGLPSMLEVANKEEFAKKYTERYERLVTGAEKWENDSERVSLIHGLAWMEHRRWNAFTRIKGFRKSDYCEIYSENSGSYKQMDLKLHPCLVECDQEGIRIKAQGNSVGKEPFLLQFGLTDDLDRLDRLSVTLRDKGLNDYDFKMYDYPITADKLEGAVTLPQEIEGNPDYDNFHCRLAKTLGYEIGTKATEKEEQYV